MNKVSLFYFSFQDWMNRSDVEISFRICSIALLWQLVINRSHRVYIDEDWNRQEGKWRWRNIRSMNRFSSLRVGRILKYRMADDIFVQWLKSILYPEKDFVSTSLCCLSDCVTWTVPPFTKSLVRCEIFHSDPFSLWTNDQKNLYHPRDALSNRTRSCKRFCL